MDVHTAATIIQRAFRRSTTFVVVRIYATLANPAQISQLGLSAWHGDYVARAWRPVRAPLTQGTVQNVAHRVAAVAANRPALAHKSFTHYVAAEVATPNGTHIETLLLHQPRHHVREVML